MQIPYRHFFLFVGTSYLFQLSSILRSDIVPFFDPSSIPLFLLWQVSFFLVVSDVKASLSSDSFFRLHTIIISLFPFYT